MVETWGKSASCVRRSVGRVAGAFSGDGGTEYSLGTGKGGRKSGIWAGAFHSVRGRFLDGEAGIETGDGGNVGEGRLSCLGDVGSVDVGSSTTISTSDSPGSASSSELGEDSGNSPYTSGTVSSRSCLRPSLRAAGRTGMTMKNFP